MQTLISVFDRRTSARKAMDRLVQSGFSRDDVRLHESAEQAGDEVHDRGVLDSLGRAFVSMFGKDRGDQASGHYGEHVERGYSVVIVDAHTDQEAESAAVTLHECGAVEVEDRDSAGGTPSLPGVRTYERASSPMPELTQRATQVSNEMKEDREERAYASAMNHVDRDRPK